MTGVAVQVSYWDTDILEDEDVSLCGNVLYLSDTCFQALFAILGHDWVLR